MTADKHRIQKHHIEEIHRIMKEDFDEDIPRREDLERPYLFKPPRDGACAKKPKYLVGIRNVRRNVLRILFCERYLQVHAESMAARRNNGENQ